MAITITTPIVVPETIVPEKTFSKMWIQSLHVVAVSPTNPVIINVTLVPYDETTGEMLLEHRKSFSIEDALTLAASDTNLAATLNAIYNEVDRQAKRLGVI